MMCRPLRLRILVALFCSCTATLPLLAQAPSRVDPAVTPAPHVKWADIPLSFEPNMGQEPSEVRYLARGSSYTLYLAGAEMVLSGNNQVPLRMKLLGADLTPRITGESQQVSTSNYLVGNDPARWRTSVPNYGKARYSGVYPGIDLVYYGNDGTLEYDWIVSPSANPRTIRLSFDGADRVRVDKQGELVITVGKTEYRQRKPVVYQEVGGKRIEIAGTWFSRGREAGFRIGTYDRGQPLIIDPVLYYSTYLGGNASDYAYAIAADRAGNSYITGGTGSAHFPTANPLQASLRGSVDVFVTKINANGSGKLYSTYLGGGGPDEGRGIAVNSHGEAYVTGSAGSFDFPMMGAIQGTWGGSGDAFLTKLNASGSGLVYSTYLGGNAIDYGTAIALDPAGNAYVVGVTFSTNFPTVNPFQAVKGAQQDAFVAKINPGGTAWVYSTYLGGNNVDEGYGIAADATGNAYITGYTASTNFPMQSPFQGANAGSVDAFVTKLNAAGSALVYSTYLGGAGTDYGNAIAVDSSGSAYVTGVVASDNFPLANPIDSTLGSHAVDDAFVTKFNPSGSALVYSTYLGGGSEDEAYAIAIDQAGNAWVTGRTNSSDFPLTNPLQITRFAFDMFITEINAAGSARLFSTFLGGSGSESGRGIVVDSVGNVHIAGESTSLDFPVVNAVQMTSGGVQDAIALLLANVPPPSVFNDFTRGCSSGQLLYDPSVGQSYTALSNGNGTYNYVPNLLTSGFDTLRSGDFNGDGKADLIVYNSKTSLAYIGMGNGDGTFTFQSLFWSPGYDVVETGDINGDGKTDVVLYNSSTGTLYTGISDGAGGFTYLFHLVSSNLTYVRLADFTGDGKADLFLYSAANGLAYLGVGDGTGAFTFHAVSMSPGYDVADVADLNGDGKADLIVYNSTNGNAATGISDGLGGLTFTALGFTPGFTSVRLADYTGDGNADVTVYNKSNGSAYFGTGNGNGTFTFASLFWSPGYDEVIPEDVNCDGNADVILYNRSTGTEYTGISNGRGAGGFSYNYSLWGPGKLLVDQNHLRALPVVVTPPPVTREVGANFGGTPGGDAFLYKPSTGAWSMQVSTAGNFGGIGSGVWANWTIQAGDFNGDGLTDLFLYNPTNGLWFKAINQGAGSFSFFGGTWAPNWNVTLLDFDGDGKTDVFLYNQTSGRWFRAMSVGDGDFSYFTGVWAPGWSIYPADFNGDGRADLFLYNHNAASDPNHGLWFRVITQADGSFTYLLGDVRWANTWTVTPADLNGDGLTDLFLYNPANGQYFRVVFINGVATYDGGTWAANWTISKGDFNGDGRADLFLYNKTTGLWFVVITNPDGTLSYFNGLWAPNWDVTVTDFDADGRSDILLYNQATGMWFQAVTLSPGTFSFTTGNWGTGWNVIGQRTILP